MKRALFLIGAGVGYVLGARAGRARYEQIADAARRIAASEPAQRAGAFAQARLDDAADGIARLGGSLGEKSRELPTRLVHTTESLRDDLRRRADELGEQSDALREDLRRRAGELGEQSDALREDLRRRAGELGEQLTDAVERPREYFGEVVERSRDRQAQEIVTAGDRRDETLASLGTEHDEMIDEGGADERNLGERDERGPAQG